MRLGFVRSWRSHGVQPTLRPAPEHNKISVGQGSRGGAEARRGWFGGAIPLFAYGLRFEGMRLSPARPLRASAPPRLCVNP